MSSPTAHPNRQARSRARRVFFALFALAMLAALVGAMFVSPASRTQAAAAPADKLDLNRTPVPDYNVNLGKSSVRLPSPSRTTPTPRPATGMP